MIEDTPLPLKGIKLSQLHVFLLGGLENGLGKGHAELQLPETDDFSEGYLFYS